MNEEKNTIIVNMLAGSGAGKSTNSARLFAMMKDLGIEVELVNEWIKDMVWEERKEVFKCQPYITSKQLYKIQRVCGKVDVIITDSPIILGALYGNNESETFKKFVIEKFNSFNNINIFLNRTKKFNPNGRNERTIEEARSNDKKLINILNENNIKYTVVDGNEEGCKQVLKMILDRLNKDGE